MKLKHYILATALGLHITTLHGMDDFGGAFCSDAAPTSAVAPDVTERFFPAHQVEADASLVRHLSTFLDDQTLCAFSRSTQGFRGATFGEREKRAFVSAYFSEGPRDIAVLTAQLSAFRPDAPAVMEFLGEYTDPDALRGYDDTYNRKGRIMNFILGMSPVKLPSFRANINALTAGSSEYYTKMEFFDMALREWETTGIQERIEILARFSASFNALTEGWHDYNKTTVILHAGRASVKLKSGLEPVLKAITSHDVNVLTAGWSDGDKMQLFNYIMDWTATEISIMQLMQRPTQDPVEARIAVLAREKEYLDALTEGWHIFRKMDLLRSLIEGPFREETVRERMAQFSSYQSTLDAISERWPDHKKYWKIELFRFMLYIPFALWDECFQAIQASPDRTYSAAIETAQRFIPTAY